MAKLNEEELMLLVNFMYIKGSTDLRDLSKTIYKLSNEVESDIEETLLSGDVTQTEALQVLSKMAQSENLMNLKAVEQIDGDVRAVCFVDKRDNEASLIIRGTGGTYRAWFDNIKGLVVSDTKLQKDLAKFFDRISPQYNIRTIAGHSKGGNLAQYITVSCKNKIARCFSFDGQGFSRKFLSKYKDSIKLVRSKIVSISSYMDPINGLLNPITKNRFYLKTDLNDNSVNSALGNIKKMPLMPTNQQNF